MQQKGRSLSTHSPFFNHNLNVTIMRDKNSQNRRGLSFTKKKESYTTVLPTEVVVERTKVNGIEQIHVIDAEVVETAKRPSFFISETILKAKRLWKLL